MQQGDLRDGAVLDLPAMARASARRFACGLRGGQSRYTVTDLPRSPCGNRNRYVLQMPQSQGVSIGAPQVSQSGDWIACVWRRVASQAGVFTRAYLRNAATDWSYGSALLHRVPSGVLRGKAALQHASVHSAGVFKSAAGNSSIPIGQPASLRSIRSRNN